MLVYFFYYVIMSKFYVSVLMSTCMYCMNCFFPSDNAVRAAFLCKHVRLSRVFYNKQYLLTYLLHERRGARRPLRTPRPTNSSGRIYWPAGRRPVITIHHPSRPQAGCGTAADAQQARTLSVLHSNWRIAVFITL